MPPRNLPHDHAPLARHEEAGDVSETPMVCAECGFCAVNEHGFNSHWAQKHWLPNKKRPLPLPVKVWTRGAEEITKRLT